MGNIDSETIRNRASQAGLVLGAVSGGYIFIEELIKGSQSGAAGFAGIFLWTVKLILCIMLMKRFMVKLCDECPEANMFDTKKLGLWTAIFSGIITAACSYVALQYVFPDSVKESMDMVYKMYGSQLDSNTKDVLLNMEADMPLYSCITMFIWCVIYGYALSGILSRRVPGMDPFKQFENKDSNDEE